jgi:hypothetical protein
MSSASEVTVLSAFLGTDSPEAADIPLTLTEVPIKGKHKWVMQWRVRAA